MDPRVLLDPRGAFKRGGPAGQQPNNMSTPQLPQYDPRALMNPKSISKRPASSEGDTDRGRVDQTSPMNPGQISLVERLHNVHERTASPSKRVKTDEEHNKKSHINAAGRGGALDLRPRDGQQIPTAPPGPTAAIDLTMSDDEDADVEVVKDNSAQVICIGKIRQAYVQTTMVPFTDPKKYSGNYGQQSRIKVSFRRGGGHKGTHIIMVTDPTSREFGRVDVKTAQALAPLMDAAKVSGLYWMSWTEPRRKQPGEGPSGSPLNTLIGMTLQLYCPRKVSHDIGRFLKGRGVELVDPQFELSRYDYFNPHTNASFTRADVANPNFEPAGYNNRYAPASGSYVLRSVEEIRADVSNMFDTIAGNDDLPFREPTQLIKTSLYPHQKKALHFMWDKEQDRSGPESDDRKDSLFQAKLRNNGQKYYVHVITGEETKEKPNSVRGGILADDMGLGKTLSVLSLVADDNSMADAKAFTNKAPPPPMTVRHLVGLGDVIRQVRNSRATLLVCPLSTMTNWKEQLESHFPDGKGLKWIRYHGPERKQMTVNDLADHDLVITTYQIISKDTVDQKMPLQQVNWFRIVLDEAHAIRSTSTAQSKAACRLAGQRRWAVTGTPVQNRLEDLGALFQFLRLKPFETPAGFNHHILNPFKLADPEVIPKLQLLVSSVTLRRTKDIIDLPPRQDLIVRLDFAREERRLHDWFEQDTQRKVNAVTAGEKLGGHSYARILTAILNLRLICAHGRDLLSDEALKLTDGMTYENPMEINDEDEEAPALNRQQAYEMLELLDQTNADECQYCRRLVLEVDPQLEEDDAEVPETIGFMTSCYHLVCPRHIKRLRDDWAKIAQPDGFVKCQFCDERVRQVAFELKREDYSAFQDERERIKRDPKLAKKIGGYTGPHTKTQALLKDLEEHRQWSEAHPEEPPIKSVVFSTWTTHLDLIEIALHNHGHKCVRLDGRMSRDARDKSTRLLREDPDVRVILVSIGAGGLGLNLTTANNVYMMEPQFNPAAEAQAVDRVHRLGQNRPVTIKRFIMEQSFEEKMLELQRKKKALAALTMAREKHTKDQAAKKRLEDLRSLFK